MLGVVVVSLYSIHNKRTTLVTTLVTRVSPCRALQGHYKGDYKGEWVVEIQMLYKLVEKNPDHKKTLHITNCNE